MKKTTVQNTYRFIKKIDSGSFGDVYLTQKRGTERSYAAKVEKRHSTKLLDEYNIYTSLYKSGFRIGLPKVYTIIQTPDYNMMFMQLLGLSLDAMFNRYKFKFDLGTVFLLADQLITLLESLHNLNYIHRDIKPGNFLVGKDNKNNQIYMLDLGLSKKYIVGDKHIEMKTGKSLVGTARYASRNIHRGIEPSRRDDMESLGYVLVYFLKKKLPWQGIKKSTKKEQLETIGDVKINTPISDLCKDLPICFEKYLKYCIGLDFKDKPDYEYLRDLFKDTAKKMGITPRFQWV